MNTIYCHFSRPSKAGKGPFQAADKTNDPRRFTGDKQWITEVRTSIQVSHLYPARPPGEPVRPHPNAANKPEGKMLSVFTTGIFPSLQGLRPLRRFAAIP